MIAPPPAGVAQWIEHWPMNQKVANSIWSGPMPGLWARSAVGGVQEATNQCFSPSLSPSLLLSPLSENK